MEQFLILGDGGARLGHQDLVEEELPLGELDGAIDLDLRVLGASAERPAYGG